MTLSAIVALGRNRVIGVDNVMPWHIPADLRFFKERTMGKPVVMGRKTLQSIGKPLPGRPNIVVTRDAGFAAEGATVVADIEIGLGIAQGLATELGVHEVMVIGGGQIYDQTIHLMDRLYLTEIDLAPEGHAFFPDHTRVGAWTEVWREPHPATADQPAFDFAIYERA